MSQATLVVSAHVVLYVNAQLFARVVSFQWSSATPRRAIYGIDNAQPYELAPTHTKVTGAISLLKLKADGGIEAAGMVGNVRDITREKYFSMMLVDTNTDTVIFRADRCVVTEQSWQVAAKQIVSGTVHFEVIDWENEVTATLSP